MAGGLTIPAAGATNVSRGQGLVTELSETVLGVGNPTVRLRNAATGARVRVVVSSKVNAAGHTVVKVKARKKLERNTRYMLTLTSAIRDAAGNSLSTTTRTFRTRK